MSYGRSFQFIAAECLLTGRYRFKRMDLITGQIFSPVEGCCWGRRQCC